MLLFETVGLLTNTAKTQAIIYILGKIQMRLSSCSYARRYIGLQTATEWAAWVVECNVCRDKLVAS